MNEIKSAGAGSPAKRPTRHVRTAAERNGRRRQPWLREHNVDEELAGPSRSVSHTEPQVRGKNKREDMPCGKTREHGPLGANVKAYQLVRFQETRSSRTPLPTKSFSTVCSGRSRARRCRGVVGVEITQLLGWWCSLRMELCLGIDH